MRNILNFDQSSGIEEMMVKAFIVSREGYFVQWSVTFLDTIV